jgi:hypothetical protein
VPQQFFATSMVRRRSSGLDGHRSRCLQRRIRIAPHLPPDWGFAAVDNVPVGPVCVSSSTPQRKIALSVRRRGGEFAPACRYACSSADVSSKSPGKA